METLKTLLLVHLFAIALLSCGGGGSEDIPLSTPSLTPIPTDTIDNKVQLLLDFSESSDGWNADFADYPIKDINLFDFISAIEPIPPQLESMTGYRLTGNNRSDDLIMFIKKGFNGFVPNAQYQLIFEITFATNIQSDCVGVGGPPGEAVTIKAGASINEPLKVLDNNDVYRMNIDIGNQKNSGQNAIAMGNFANSQQCDLDNAFYELKTLTNANDNTKSLIIKTDSKGVLWFLFATDSGFESLTNIYFVKGSIVATNLSPLN
ncbi:hypothetical protein MNBD_GAMMA22-1382 [hydrothermal vent metagenome]|uniref:Lipoprotein n=1 Tax=hydrothermal vent metagenome TaxID=652676 RepID=A0A3B0ZZP2_9ZZZZ